MAERLLIVGGTGFIGKNLAINAIKHGYNTIVLSLNAPTDEKRVYGVDYLQADITNFAQLQAQLSDTAFDYVVNLSGYIDHCSFLEGGRQIVDIHFGGVQNLLQSLDWSVLKRFVQIGSSNEYGNLPAPQSEEMRESPISSYSLGKVASTQLLQMLNRTEGFPAVTLRLFLVYGPGQDNKRFLPQIIQGCFSDAHFPTSAGDQVRDFCYVDDTVRAILQALTVSEATGEVFNVASGEPISIRTMIEKVCKLTGSGKPQYGEVPYRSCENMTLYANISKAKKILQWEPSISLDRGLQKTIDCFVNNHA